MQNVIVLEHAREVMDALNALKTTNPTMNKGLKKLMKNSIGNARKQVVKDAKSVLPRDPRRARNAVKHSSYKRVLGGNISIYSARKAGKTRPYTPVRKLQPGQRGGNRWLRSERTERMDSYWGKDRAFILRWTNKGTLQRHIRRRTNKGGSNYGNRGSITGKPWFASSARNAMTTAEKEFKEGLFTAVNEVWKNR